MKTNETRKPGDDSQCRGDAATCCETTDRSCCSAEMNATCCTPEEWADCCGTACSPTDKTPVNKQKDTTRK